MSQVDSLTGRVLFSGQDLLQTPDAQMKKIRGGRIGLIPQDPGSALNPMMRVGTQIAEALRLHRGLAGQAARAAARRLLDQVGIPDAANRLNRYPFEFSGGQKQRLMIAIALAGEPDLLIADEPTTALDVTIQAQILDLLAQVQRDTGMAMVLISHDLGVISQTCRRVAVMYAGRVVEVASSAALFRDPAHPYARGLANSHTLIFDNRDPVLADRRIRQALSFAIDRQKLVDTLWLGLAKVPASHNYPEFGQMYVEGRSLPFDPEKAKMLLQEAGYAGQPIIYRSQPAYYTNALEAAQVMIEMWKAVGLNASLQVVETSAQMREEGNSQISNWSNSTRLPDPLGALWVSWGPGGEVQSTDIWSPESREAFNAAGMALEAETDPAKRKALFVTMLDEWEKEVPGTILYQPFEAYAIRRSIQWRPTTFYFMDLRPDNLTFGA
ncbi:ATP-binding cassette domain-containing protein [Paracoccus subflavus]|uniref:ATP-binding cassette domain-containing protein n=1 Tax=Paracoccus subflavus TaxID=2528244 RepID=A0A4V2JC57_9RHOB|nr:ABC transporter substrate-binding protein [Paracoccus subflavus]TBN39533.1 ATP-binding cassette domain-containing protein [Paracoccus subflavus]